jgi:hypothetical protein
MISQQRNSVKNVTTSSNDKGCATYFQIFYLLVLAENEIKNRLINLTRGRLCSDLEDSFAKGVLLFRFLIRYSMWGQYFPVATGTTISCNLARQNGPVLSQSFLDANAYDTTPH